MLPMIVTLLHSSKTMRRPQEYAAPLGSPLFLKEAQTLVDVWRGASPSELEKHMHISAKKTSEVEQLYKAWSSNAVGQIPAVDAFIGDIYSGLQVQDWSKDDRRYAHDHLFILSGLYGVLHACDGIVPYRLEMGYKLPDGQSMYAFWGDTIACALPASTDSILNLSAVEYTKALLPFIDIPVITPKFLTINKKTGEPVFVVVHAKIARGAYASWVILHRVENHQQLKDFNELGYMYDELLSTDNQPVFVCQNFDGLGLSVRRRN